MPMSKIPTRALALSLVTLALCVTVLPSRAATNLLKNPGFEDPVRDHAWMAASWDTSQTGLPSVFF